MLRVVFIGTQGDYSLRPLRALLGAHEVVAIVQSAPVDTTDASRPLQERLADAFATRSGHKSLWTVARQHRIPYFRLTRHNLPEFRALLDRLHPDVGCIASMNHLLPADCLARPRYGFLNFHPSVLPALRGPNVWFWHYHSQALEAGATIIRIDEGEDTGDILRQESFPAPLALPPAALTQRAIALGSRLLVAAVDDLAAGRSCPRVQRHLPSPVRARYLRAGDKLFAWRRWTLAQTHHFLQGSAPWYDALGPEHGWLGHLRWTVTGYAPGPTPGEPDRIRLDRRGAYFAHPEGRIRLRPRGLGWRLVALAALVLAVVRLR